ncbi:chromosome segregation protein SMC [Tuberibacillus sp. Marseille-P3662]|uniref:chromosome segregation protein SMC n=1 Tax=Tuberibacillus sp. Marseille-P3662 TaxID=1965358 RepID=UPI000A1CC2FB|nr:chromosome segregation protein SMC [Tuberibacillus sp. Marseille-P3662]
MFLKQLEVVGFKSFANKINVEFVPGVTSVVGPNGSGKSNIADAVRWVLGEQSAKSLRGAKMEDIIFAGSDAKQPLNMAEVTLILDNSDQYLAYDFNEVSVTRRVFRSGDSEYLLNNQKCRLKDIVDLFMDSGLGREAYSIIGQGKIDEILNSKPEDKRKIFEEAAGVLKYKHRKQDAEKKLNESQDNLDRIEDIIFELENQVGPLEEQASVAKDYLHKKESLEKTEVALYAYDIEIKHKEWQERADKIEQLKTKESEQTSAIQERQANNDEKRTTVQALDESIGDLQESLLLASQMVEKYEGQKNVLEERAKHAQENAHELDDRIKKLTDQQKTCQLDVEQEAANYKQQKQTLDDLNDQLQQRQDQLDHFKESIENEIEQLKADYIELLNDQASSRNEIRYLNEQKQQMTERAKRLGDEDQGVSHQHEQLDQQRRGLNDQLQSITDQEQTESEAYRSNQAKLDEAKRQYQKRKDALTNIDQYLRQAQSKKDMLEDMNDDYSGYFHGVKKVLQSHQQLNGIHGAVAELVRVDKTHEKAIETALGGAAQNIIVDQENDAREAIRFLKHNGAGRATFLPLSVIKPRFVARHDLNKMSQHSVFVGTADQLVNCKEEHQHVIRHLLGNVIIAEHLKGANALAKVIQHKHRIVTLEGDIVNPGGSMSGGSQKNNKVSLIGRQRDIEKLTEQIEEMEQQKQTLSDQVTKLNDQIKQLQPVVQEKHQVLSKLGEQKQSLVDQLRDVDYEIKSMTDKGDLIKRERETFTSEIQAIDNKLKQLHDKQTTLKDQDHQLNRRIEELEEQKKNEEATKERLQNEWHDLKVKKARQQEVVTNLKDRLDERQADLQSITQQLDTANQAIQEVGSHLDHQQYDQQTLDENIQQCRQDKEAITHWIEERREKRQQIYQQLEAAEQELKEEQRLLKETTETLKREELAHERVDVALDNLLNGLRENYELSFEAAKERYTLPDDIEAARQEVKLLKRSIDELGTVNLASIDEYERVSERLTFLQEQKNDLIEAKQTLLDVISEMDEEVRSRFEYTFYSVQDQFKVIFQQLFGGGRADLALTDEHDLLNSGVDILAQPPGKKLQHLSLLSGGERALTAIALLFSILRVRPVPFCVLDEVEAALDEANVDRYAEFLKTFSQGTQFIVITHRKGTMEQSDVLYGVTMQESGVSKLVSVRLEETKELIEAT